MDWFRQVPIGQYVDGNSSWLRRIDPRLKFGWVLMFLLTPILSGPFWRLGLVIGLFLLTFLSSLSSRIWRRSLLFLLFFALFVGCFAMFLPAAEPSLTIPVRDPNELKDVSLAVSPWNVFELDAIKFGGITLGPISINRRSAELGLKTSTLIFTVVQSVNLMLITTPPEDLMWAIRWFIAPLALFGLPIDRISFQLLLALRFLPLVQEELQNLLRSLASRAVNIKKLGFKTFFGLILSVGERFLANILLRAEQGADALAARGGFFLSAEVFRPQLLINFRSKLINLGAVSLLIFVLGLRSKYGAL